MPTPENEENLTYSEETPPEEADEQQELSEEERERVTEITKDLEVGPEEVVEAQKEDVVSTLENGHELNRIWRDEEGQIEGYLACEDLGEDGVYVKYFATEGETNRSIFSEVNQFIEEAQKAGYTYIDFHGWNERLNRIMSRYGFRETARAQFGEETIGYYHLDLDQYASSESNTEETETDTDEKTAQLQEIREQLGQEETSVESKREEQLRKEREKAQNQREKALENLDEEQQRELVERRTEETMDSLARDLEEALGENYDDYAQEVLRTKLIRHFSESGGEDTIDIPTLRDALLENPKKSLRKLQGSIQTILDKHYERTLQRVAELRKQRYEMTGEEEFNPHIAEFQTESGEYYLARLINMPQLEEETMEMNNCVGQDDHYINEIRKENIEVFSLRSKESDQPVLTIEYDRRNNSIRQMKEYDDAAIRLESEYFEEIIDMLSKFENSVDDSGQQREIHSIQENLSHLADNGEIITNRGLIPYSEYNPEEDTFVLYGKAEFDELTDAEKLQVAQKIPRLESDITKIDPELKASITEWQGSLTDASEHASLSHLEYVRESLDLDNATNIEVPELREVEGELNVSGSEKTKLPKLETVGGELDIQYSEDTEFPKLQEVRGDLSGMASKNVALSELETIGGELNISRSKGLSFPKLREVEDLLVARNSEDNDFPELEHLGEHLDIEHSEHLSFSKLQEVEGMLKAEQSKENIFSELKTVKEELYINESEGLSFPKLQEVESTLEAEKSENVEFPELESIVHALNINSSEDLSFPKLREVKSLLKADNSKDVSFPNLETVEGKLTLKNTEDLSFPKLKEVEDRLSLPKSKRAKFPELEKVGEINAWRAEDLHTPKLDTTE